MLCLLLLPHFWEFLAVSLGILSLVSFVYGGYKITEVVFDKYDKAVNVQNDNNTAAPSINEATYTILDCHVSNAPRNDE